MKSINDYLCEKCKSGLLYLYDKLNNYNNYNPKNNGEEWVLNRLFCILLAGQKSFVVFDIGANVGDYSESVYKILKISGKKGQIHLFEPTKYCLKILEERFGVRKNFIINNFGASNTKRSARIFNYKESGLSSIHKRDIFNNLNTSREKIFINRLDNYVKIKRIEHINLIKIDIEGHELFGLTGLGKYLNSDFLDCIQFEYGGTYIASRTYLKDVYDLLIGKGFKIFKIFPNSLKKFEWTERDENFQYTNFFAISKKIIE